MGKLREDALSAVGAAEAAQADAAYAALERIGVAADHGVTLDDSYEEDGRSVYIFTDGDIQLAVVAKPDEMDDAEVWFVELVDDQWTRIAQIGSLVDLGEAVQEGV